MKNENMERLYKLIKNFETDNNSTTTAILFDNENSKGWYRLAISSDCLDKLDPYDATLKVIKYLKENDPTIYPDIPFNIIPVHTEDETIHRVRESFEEGIRYFNKAELFYDTLTNVYVMI